MEISGWFCVKRASQMVPRDTLSLCRTRRNPRDWRIEDLKVVADKLGTNHHHHGTSQVVFRHPKAGRLSVPAHRPIKPVYVGLIVDLVHRAGQKNKD